MTERAYKKRRVDAKGLVVPSDTVTADEAAELAVDGVLCLTDLIASRTIRCIYLDNRTPSVESSMIGIPGDEGRLDLELLRWRQGCAAVPTANSACVLFLFMEALCKREVGLFTIVLDLVHLYATDSEVEDHALAGYSSLSTVALNPRVTKIGAWAFAGCEELTVIKHENAVEIGDGAFASTGLRSVHTKKHITYGEDVYNDCRDLTSAIVDSDLTAYMFQGCENLVSVDCTNSDATDVPDSAFEDCESLVSVVLPPTAESISYRAFANCKSLTSVTFPLSMRNIVYEAFRDCERLRDVVFNPRMSYIALYAFRGCKKLEMVDLADVDCTRHAYAFPGHTIIRTRYA